MLFETKARGGQRAYAQTGRPCLTQYAQLTGVIRTHADLQEPQTYIRGLPMKACNIDRIGPGGRGHTDARCGNWYNKCTYAVPVERVIASEVVN